MNNLEKFNKIKQKCGCGYWDICTKRPKYESPSKEENDIGLCLVLGKDYDEEDYCFMKSFEINSEELEKELQNIDIETRELFVDGCFDNDIYEYENYKAKMELDCLEFYLSNTNCIGCKIHYPRYIRKVGTEQALNIDENISKNINPFENDI